MLLCCCCQTTELSLSSSVAASSLESEPSPLTGWNKAKNSRGVYTKYLIYYRYWNLAPTILALVDDGVRQVHSWLKLLYCVNSEVLRLLGKRLSQRFANHLIKISRLDIVLLLSNYQTTPVLECSCLSLESESTPGLRDTSWIFWEADIDLPTCTESPFKVLHIQKKTWTTQLPFFVFLMLTYLPTLRVLLDFCTCLKKNELLNNPTLVNSSRSSILTCHPTHRASSNSCMYQKKLLKSPITQILFTLVSDWKVCIVYRSRKKAYDERPASFSHDPRIIFWNLRYMVWSDCTWNLHYCDAPTSRSV